MLVIDSIAAVAHRIFGHAECICASHATVLKGYDESGVARTKQSAHYWPQLAQALATFVVESCGSNQEGERGDKWSEALNSTNRTDLAREIARAAAADQANARSPIFHVGTPTIQPLSKSTITGTDHRSPIFRYKLSRDKIPPRAAASKPKTAATQEQEIELWMESADGAYRVSEVGGIEVPKTVAEAKASKW
jgi:hypothetical protein